MSKRRQGVGGNGRRCVAPECGRFVKKGKALCRLHRRGQAGKEMDEAVRQVAGEVEQLFGSAQTEREERRQAAAARFRRGLEQGEYRGLFDGRLGEVMAQAAAERGLADEIGALRVVLARLLAEEEDPGKLALGVARVVQASVRAAREHRALVGGPEDEIQATLMQVLTELDEEQDRARALRDGTGAGGWGGEDEPAADQSWGASPVGGSFEM